MTPRSQAPSLVGLHVLLPKHRDEDREIDICFVHNLGGHPLKSWWHKSSTASQPWIADPAFLGDILQQARIMTFGYSADLSHCTNQDILIEHAHSLLEHLADVRQKHKERPLLFIAHSLGGVIVKKVLLIARSNDRYRGLLLQRTSVVFLGTPHEFPSRAAARTVLRRLANNIESITSVDLLPLEPSVLESQAPFIINVQKLFMADVGKDIKIICFYEELRTHILQEPCLVVNKSTACMNVAGAHNFAMHATHHELCAFESPYDPRFQDVFLPRIMRLIEKDISRAPPENQGQQDRSSIIARHDLPSYDLTSDTVFNKASNINPDSEALQVANCNTRGNAPTDIGVRQGVLAMDSSSVHVDSISYNITHNISTQAAIERNDLFSSLRLDSSKTSTAKLDSTDHLVYESSRSAFLSSLVGFTDANLGGSVPSATLGTCSWIEHHPTFRDGWLQDPKSRLLLITGDSGCGKSSLAKQIREHITAFREDSDMVLAFFCNSARIRGHESPIVDYFVKELVRRSPEMYRHVNEYQTLETLSGSLTFFALMDILDRIAKDKSGGKIFLIVDGLDECDPAFVSVFLPAIRRMLRATTQHFGQTARSVKMAVLSRPSPSIRPMAGDLHIRISDKHVNADIATFVRDRIGQLNLHENRSSVEAHIIKLAGNSFLWAVSVLAQLEKLEDTSLAGIMAIFNQCPRSMEKYYEQALLELVPTNNSLCSNLLEFILWSVKPLTKLGLGGAVAVSLDRHITYEEFENAITRMSTKLIRIGAQGEVSLIHHSLREYLIARRDPERGHSLVFHTSLQCVMRTAEQTDFKLVSLTGEELMRARRELLSGNPFLLYASWMFHHGRLCKSRINSSIHLITRFASRDLLFLEWEERLFSRGTTGIWTSFLSLMAFHGLTNLLRQTDVRGPSLANSLLGYWDRTWTRFRNKGVSDRLVLFESGGEVHTTGQTLLHAFAESAAGFNPEFAWLYRRQNEDIDPRSHTGLTPLALAVIRENREAVDLLLQWGADPLIISSDGFCMVAHAAALYQTDILRLLLERLSSPEYILGRKKNVESNPFWNEIDASQIDGILMRRLGFALRDSLLRGYAGHVALLTEYGAREGHVPLVPCCQGGYQSVLHEAIRRGLDSSVYWLLSRSDLSSSGSHHGYSALLLAIALERLDYTWAIIEQLGPEKLSAAELDIIAEPDGETILHFAACRGTPDILHTLLSAGAPSDIPNAFGRLPLDVAILYDKLSHAKILIDHGCSVNRFDISGTTPLSLACNLELDSALPMVDMLLDAGAKPCINESWGTFGPLDIAASRGYTAIIERLLDSHFAPAINYVHRRTQSALASAIHHGHREAAELLIARGADVNLDNGHLLWQAVNARDNSSYMVRLLLTHGARVPLHNTYQCPLRHAVHGNNLEVLELLIASTSSMNLDGTSTSHSCGISALHLAFARGYKQCAFQLIKHGCNMTPTPHNIPLLLAAAQCDKVWSLRYLLDHPDWTLWIDVRGDVNDPELRASAIGQTTALAHACSCGKRAAALLLLSRGAQPTFAKPGDLVEHTALGSCIRSRFPGSLRLAKALLHSSRNIPQCFLDASLAFAVSHHRFDIVQLLVENGADSGGKFWLTSILGKDVIVLPKDCEEEASESTRSVDEGLVALPMVTAEVTGRYTESKETPIRSAVRYGSLEIVEALLASPKSVDSDGIIADDTLLHIACSTGNQLMISSLLIATGAGSILSKPENVDILVKARNHLGLDAVARRVGSRFCDMTLQVDWLHHALASCMSKLERRKTINAFASSGSLEILMDCIVDLDNDRLAIAAFHWLEMFAMSTERHAELVCTRCDGHLVNRSLMICRQCSEFRLCEPCFALFVKGSYLEPKHASHQFLTVAFRRLATTGATERRREYRTPVQQRLRRKKPRFSKWLRLDELVERNEMRKLHTSAKAWLDDVKAEYGYKRKDGTVVEGRHQANERLARLVWNISICIKPVALTTAVLGIDVTSQRVNKGADDMVPMEKVWKYVEDTWRAVEGWEYIEFLDAFWSLAGDRGGRVPDAYTPWFARGRFVMDSHGRPPDPWHTHF